MAIEEYVRSFSGITRNKSSREAFCTCIGVLDATVDPIDFAFAAK